jgi:hypothetical protein
LPIDENYPKDRIVFKFDDQIKRYIQVGTGAIDPAGITAETADLQSWSTTYPMIRPTMTAAFAAPCAFLSRGIKSPGPSKEPTAALIIWLCPCPMDYPSPEAWSSFKTHAYTPEKEGNYSTYTFHWDNIRFSGPVVGRYEAFDASDVVYLQANGDRAIGESQTVTIDLPHIGAEPVLFGQVHSPKQGQVLLSINGGPQIVVNPYDYNPGTCSSTGWKSFQLPLDEGVVGTRHQHVYLDHWPTAVLR